MTIKKPRSPKKPAKNGTGKSTVKDWHAGKTSSIGSTAPASAASKYKVKSPKKVK
jgi:hypothetical protein